MAIYWLDGFDTYSDSNKLTDVYDGQAGSTIESNGVILNRYRAFWGGYIRKVFNISNPELYIGVHMNVIAFYDAVSYCIRIYEDSTNYFDVIVLTTDEIRIARNNTTLATSTLKITRGAFYPIKVYILKSLSSSGICKVWYNNQLYIDYSGVTATSSTNTAEVRLGDPCVGVYGTAYDNYYIADEDLGELYLQPIVPVAAGYYTQFTPQGSSNNWDNVDEIQWSDSNYNYSNTNGHKDTYKYTDNPISSGFIKAILFAPNLSKSLGDYTGGKLVVRYNNTDWVSNNLIVPSINPREYLSEILTTNPITGNPWNLSEFSGSSRVEFGMQVVK